MDHRQPLRLRGTSENIQVLMLSTHTTTSHMASINTHNQPRQVLGKHAYLISSTFSATSMHIDERKRSHHESRYVTYEKEKSRPILFCDKGEAGEMQWPRIYLFIFLPEVFNPTKKKKHKFKTHRNVLCTNKSREKRRPVRLLRPAPLV